MTRKGKYILAGIAAATVGLAAAGAIAQRGHWEGHKGRHHFGPGASAGLLGLGFGGPHGRICRGDSAEFADLMLVRLEHRVKVTDEQKPAFEEFKTATRAAADKLREGCPKKPEASDENTPRKTPIERLAQTQAGLEASLEALKTYRPAAEKFYASLTEEQKAKLTERRGKGHWKRDHGPDQKGGHGPDDQKDGPAPGDKG
ncbi:MULTISPECIES: Spy/CpxP family protein refolding chaperone [Hyphomicrobium]|jgi:hypothetical protein|uniref:Spy/CpxP family protein refolding chaperone n=1 Tax=Hyphomicrobium TaxID=81 RepID=UPI00036E2521|nr:MULTISPECIES: Spy/CpxP family protein refolding chaperone [Hyphomicrobium]WBT40258.1 Spy/CpxP family protein refolding chaperone [Hyphomicrobium sp. DMF-1]